MHRDDADCAAVMLGDEHGGSRSGVHFLQSRGYLGGVGWIPELGEKIAKSRRIFWSCLSNRE